MTDSDRYLIGVDIGGTFTDAVVVAPDGGITVGKVSTTPEDFSQGFFASITAAAAALGLQETLLWRRTERLAHGTTVGINALVTGDVARTAYIATRGHGDSIRAMGGGGRILGASLEELLDYRLSSRAEPLVPRERVVEVSERLDRDGKIVVSLSDAKLEEILTRLEALDVQAVAISYLWSFVNSVHEERTAQYLRDARPDLFISCSHEIAPRIGEYPRSASTLLNAQIGPLMTSYIERIVAGSRQRGLGGDLLFAQSEGSLVPASEAALFPLRTLQSGPVAGVVGSARVGPSMGYPKVIITDMGGTTLDAATVENGGVRFREDGEVVRQRAYLRKVEVESVGAGGGSIAWVHEASGTLRVGPRSAGALPGPICYGRGGNEVTVTDADLVLGILDADRPLAGGLRLDLDAARAGIERVGAPLGLSVDECAAGIVEIVDSRMDPARRRPAQLLTLRFRGRKWCTCGALRPGDRGVPGRVSPERYGIGVVRLRAHATRPGPKLRGERILPHTLRPEGSGRRPEGPRGSRDPIRGGAWAGFLRTPAIGRNEVPAADPRGGGRPTRGPCGRGLRRHADRGLPPHLRKGIRGRHRLCRGRGGDDLTPGGGTCRLRVSGDRSA
jgi:N-methylhydantoinase A